MKKFLKVGLHPSQTISARQIFDRRRTPQACNKAKHVWEILRAYFTESGCLDHLPQKADASHIIISLAREIIRVEPIDCQDFRSGDAKRTASQQADLKLNILGYATNFTMTQAARFLAIEHKGRSECEIMTLASRAHRMGDDAVRRFKSVRVKRRHGRRRRKREWNARCNDLGMPLKQINLGL